MEEDYWHDYLTKKHHDITRKLRPNWGALYTCSKCGRIFDVDGQGILYAWVNGAGDPNCIDMECIEVIIQEVIE